VFFSTSRTSFISKTVLELYTVLIFDRLLLWVGSGGVTDLPSY